VDRFRNNPDSLKIRCGEWDTQDQTEPRPHQDRFVTSLDIHPAFNERNLAIDWALLYTETPFQLEEHIDTVCLPQPGDQFVGQTCFATGWGKDRFGAAGQYQVVLKEIDLPVVGHDECEAKLRTTRLGKRFQLDDSFICAGGQDGKDTCKGDGGSPLVCPSKYDPYTYIQAGVVAWGIGCGEDNVPGVYASVAEGVCWMDYAMSCRTGSGSSYWGYGRECQDWMDTLQVTLQAQVQDMQDQSITGRRKTQALRDEVRAQQVLEYFNNGCSINWDPQSESQVNGGEDGYTEVDISSYGRTVAGIGAGFSGGLVDTQSIGDTLVDTHSVLGDNTVHTQSIGDILVDTHSVPGDNTVHTQSNGDALVDTHSVSHIDTHTPSKYNGASPVY